MTQPHPADADSRPPRAGTLGIEQRFLRRWNVLREQLPGPLIVGFSGGPDSLALATLLSRLRRDLGRDIILVHVDHRLRAESSREADRARELARELELPFVLKRLAEHPQQRHPSVGLEEAARRERYRALADAAADHDASVVVLAHHRDDQAETVLLHLLRGAGLAGARGFREVNSIVIPWWSQPRGATAVVRLTQWRPLIHESRAGLAAYRQHVAPQLRPISDPSNEVPDFRRNALRKMVFPQLEKIVPGASAALARFAAVAAEEDDLLTALTEAEYGTVIDEDSTLRIAALRTLHPALQRRIVRMWLQQLGVAADLSLERIDAVIEGCLSARGGWKIELGDGFTVERHRSHVILHPPPLSPEPANPISAAPSDHGLPENQ